MPKKPPPLPDADDLPEMEVDDSLYQGLGIEASNPDRLSAEADVSASLEEISVKSFEDSARSGPLNFDDGKNMGHRAH